MADPSDNSGRIFGANGMIELTGKIMVVAIILLFFVVVFFFCLHLYAKWFWYRHQENTTIATSRRRRRRLDFAGGHQEITIVRRGLDPSLLKTIPIVIISLDGSNEWEDGLLECAVCLCEVSQGEKARLLPKCNHGFHVECIDMWFQSHSTCPLCRNPVSNSSNDQTNIVEVPDFPTNVLFWSNHTHVTTLDEASSSNRPNGISVIDIPRQINEEDQEEKSPVPTKLRSLKRLMSGSNTRVNPSCPRNLDPEQGGRDHI